MADERLWHLVTALLRRTREGKISWKASFKDGVWVATFPQYSVELSKHIGARGLDFVLHLYDEDGEIVDEVSDPEFGNLELPPGEAFEAMKELYEQARRTARGATKAIDSILRSLGEEE